ncbi:Hsp20/alpha crystallin family protein [Bacillus sp. 2205SS5-2]|uniref:Hsp20/alpha crystallin family protein n=1 Tax=Bacillus sp. 2205SS5-2 TaxID=3109031 RepID=UPI0030064076
MEKQNSNRPAKNQREPFGDIMKTMNEFFHERPVKGLLSSIDEFFSSPHPFGGFPVDSEETTSEYIITAELPGVKKDQLTIDILQNYVTISVEQNEMLEKKDTLQNKATKKKAFHRSSRTIPLSTPIDERNATASYQDGLLKLILPKKKGKSIEIK